MTATRSHATPDTKSPTVVVLLPLITTVSILGQWPPADPPSHGRAQHPGVTSPAPPRWRRRDDAALGPRFSEHGRSADRTDIPAPSYDEPLELLDGDEMGSAPGRYACKSRRI